MIKICKNFYVHYLFFAVFIIFLINKNIESFFVAYIAITVHEMTHLVFAKLLGLSVDYIALYPFGLNLKLKNTMLYSISDEIILYISGPLSNVVFALLCLASGRQNHLVNELYHANTALFLVNVLPITPLDGGMIIKKLFDYRFGYEKGKKLMKILSVVFATALTAVCIYSAYINRFNPSLVIFIIFILGNILFSKEKYNKNLVKELLYTRNKRRNKDIYNAKIIGCGENAKMIDIAKKFNMKDSYFVIRTNENNKISDILCEEEIIDRLLK